MIKKIEQTIVIFIIIITPLYSNSTENDYNKFLAGIVLLKADDTISWELKVEKFHQLKSVTGVETTDAIRFLDNYKGQPMEWKTVFDSIKKLIIEKH